MGLSARLQATDPIDFGMRLKPNGGYHSDHSYGFGGRNVGAGGAGRVQQREDSPEIQEVEEKDPLALDDDNIEDLDPYDDNDDAPIIPSVNPMVDDDIAAEDQDEGPQTVDVSSFLAV